MHPAAWEPHSSHFSPAWGALQVSEGKGCSSRGAPCPSAGPSGVFLGSSLLCVLLSHQAELLVPPRGSRGHSRLWGQAKAPRWPLGKVADPPLLRAAHGLYITFIPNPKGLFRVQGVYPSRQTYSAALVSLSFNILQHFRGQEESFLPLSCLLTRLLEHNPIWSPKGDLSIPQLVPSQGHHISQGGSSLPPQTSWWPSAGGTIILGLFLSTTTIFSAFPPPRVVWDLSPATQPASQEQEHPNE